MHVIMTTVMSGGLALIVSFPMGSELAFRVVASVLHHSGCSTCTLGSLVFMRRVGRGTCTRVISIGCDRRERPHSRFSQCWAFRYARSEGRPTRLQGCELARTTTHVAVSANGGGHEQGACAVCSAYWVAWHWHRRGAGITALCAHSGSVYIV